MRDFPHFGHYALQTPKTPLPVHVTGHLRCRWEPEGLSVFENVIGMDNGAKMSSQDRFRDAFMFTLKISPSVKSPGTLNWPCQTQEATQLTQKWSEGEGKIPQSLLFLRIWPNFRSLLRYSVFSSNPYRSVVCFSQQTQILAKNALKRRFR